MSATVAIIADDLTGALDTSAPFADCGLRTQVAIGPDSNFSDEPEVIAINSASRAFKVGDAKAVVSRISRGIRETGRPRIIIKKVDTRLKGHIAAECEAVAEGFGLRRATVAVAAPDQDRWTIGGRVTGRGVDEPLDIEPLFSDMPIPVVVENVTDVSDLDRIIDAADWRDTLLVGARGLGQSLARHLCKTEGQPASRFRSVEATLFAFGSRDPITTAQIDHLKTVRPDLQVLAAPDGLVPDQLIRLPAIVRCTGPISSAPLEVAERFAEGIGRKFRALQPQHLVMGGGDTAYAICRALGGMIAAPLGEAAPGLPWFELFCQGGVKVDCVVKSGGFGRDTVLADLLGATSDQSEAANEVRTGSHTNHE